VAGRKRQWSEARTEFEGGPLAYTERFNGTSLCRGWRRIGEEIDEDAGRRPCSIGYRGQRAARFDAEAVRLNNRACGDGPAVYRARRVTFAEAFKKDPKCPGAIDEGIGSSICRKWSRPSNTCGSLGAGAGQCAGWYNLAWPSTPTTNSSGAGQLSAGVRSIPGSDSYYYRVSATGI